jgi:AcrR family transcriptional regulator
MPKRSYVSPVRADAAAEKRNRVIEAATRLLREEHSITAFSLEAVAKAAGVTRLTVYNQFGSRRGLLEAVFDDIAQRGRIMRLGEAWAAPDPLTGLELLVEIFCEFWSSDPAIGRLQDAMLIDPEIAQALGERLGRGRQIIGGLVARLAEGRATPARQRDTADLVFGLTGFAMFRLLSAGRSTEAVCGLVKTACDDAIRRMLPDAG